MERQIKSSMKNILVIGSSNIDCVITMDALPQSGETVIGRNVELHPGGKGANQAVASALLGGRTEFVTVLGDSADTVLLEDMFGKVGLDVTGVGRASNQTTGVAYINVDREGQNTIIVVPGANSKCTKEFLVSRDDYIIEADIILLQLEIPFDAVEYAIKRANELNKLIVLNPAPIQKGVMVPFIGNVDYLTPNETELKNLTSMPVNSISEITGAAYSLMKTGVKNIIVTVGKRGALLVNEDEQVLFTPPDVIAVDTTAAGDTFNGALVVGLAEGMSLHQSIRFANIAAALTVSRKGAQSAIPSRKEVDQFITQ